MPRRVVPFLFLVGLAAAAAVLSSHVLELRNRGLAQLENERPAEAEASFRQLSKLAPGEPLPWANLAIAALRQQKNEAALAAIDQALELAPKNGELLALKGEILKWAGRSEAALTLLQQAAAAAPENLEVVNALYAHASAVDSEQARLAASAALVQLGRLRPDNLVVMLRLGQAAIQRGDRAAASQDYLRVRELLWQAPPIATKAMEGLIAALEGEDVSKARVPALRLENVLKVTPMYQQSQLELTEGIVGVPLERFREEPPPSEFGKPLAITWTAKRWAEGATAPRGLAVGDFDGDRRSDLARIQADGTVEVRLAEGGFSTARPLAPSAGGVAGAGATLIAADLDNDGYLDLITARDAEGGLAGWKGAPGGTFTAATAGLGLSGLRGGTVATVSDFDVEGDLDLLTAGSHGAGKGMLQLYRNALDGTLEAVGEQAFPAVKLGPAADLVASDLDRDGDLDLLVAHRNGLTFLDNLRQGRFAERTAELGLGDAGGAQVAISADLDNDGLPELITAGPGLVVWHAADGRFARTSWGDGLPADAVVHDGIAFDADNDGRLDLALATDDGLRLLAQDGARRLRAAKISGGATGALTSVVALDIDGDGDLDLVAGGPGGLFRFENGGGNRNGWLTVRLRGLAEGNSKNNRFGVGSVVELRAGAAYQWREADGDAVHFGLGQRPFADALRVVWTNGVPQQRLQPKRNQTVVEEQLLKGSCPFLYAWNGERIEFVTDLLWNAPLGLPVAPGVWAPADPGELVEVPGAQPRDGAYRLQITEELWEAAFFDHVRLWVVDRPAAVEVASNLIVIPGPAGEASRRAPERVVGTRAVRPLAAAWDGQGREVTREVARRDEVYADGYTASRYQGVAPEWAFTFDLGEAPGRPVRLLLDGWIFPADASLNLAVAQRRDLPYLAPRLEVETAGGWQALLPAMGHPAGKTKTMVVDTPPLPAGARRLRIVSSLWLHWDRIAWSLEPADDAPRVIARLPAARAELGFGGFSAPLRRAPNAPHAYDYARRSARSPWLPLPGHYTRYGDVGELLAAADDRSVILAAGDELTLEFDASALPPPAPGTTRSVFLESYGWDKDADRNTWQAAQMEPLPFGAMSGYPYAAGESFPDTPALRRYRSRWLTREVGAPPVGPDTAGPDTANPGTASRAP